MNINTAAIAEYREGATGDELADFILRSVARQIKSSSYATAHPADRASAEIGLLTYELRKVCNMLAEAVEDPEPNATQEDFDELALGRMDDERGDTELVRQLRQSIVNARRATGLAV